MLKAEPTTANIPVLLLSAVTDIDMIAKDSKADGFIEKPFDLENLLTLIRTTLSTLPAERMHNNLY